MKTQLLSLVAVASALGVSGQATAHHPDKIERCQSITLTGKIQRIEWRRPHVELVVEADDGEIDRLTWAAINQLELAGIGAETLRIGDQVTISAGLRPNEAIARPFLLYSIVRMSDGWGWSQAPQGC